MVLSACVLLSLNYILLYVATKHEYRIAIPTNKIDYENHNENIFAQYDRNYGNDRQCNESIYWFERNSNTSIFIDRELWRRCGINDTIVHTKAAPFYSPTIQTKCRIVEPVLLSHKRTRIDPTDWFLVPNIVHYVLFGNVPFTFLNYISFKSAGKFIKPQFIFVHGDGLMIGHWWNRTLKEVDNIYYVHQPYIQLIQNKKPGWYAHQSDVIRLQVLLGELRSNRSLLKYP